MKTLSFPSHRQSLALPPADLESLEGDMRLFRALNAGLRDHRRRLQISLARLRWQTRQVERTARTLLRCAEQLRRCPGPWRPLS